MRTFKRIIATVLSATMLFPNFAGTVSFAEDWSTKSISNNYLTFSVNGETGFFNIATLEGHPQKAKDNDMDLLYTGDSIETSFTTVRLDGKDYIFGQDYGLFDLTAKRGETTVDAVNNSISTEWTINDVKITQTAYLSRTDNTTTTGNVGIEYNVENLDTKEHSVGIRVMLDNALGEIDAPVTMAQNEIAPITKETEFFKNGRNPGAHIRFLDNYETPGKEAFITFDTPIVNTPDRVLVGHWYNLASSKWEYAHDANMSFATGINEYATADTASALYWNEQTVGGGQGFSRTMLYGVGDFSTVGISGNFNITLEIDDNLEIENGRYKDDTVDARVTLYNNVDGSADLNNALLNLASEDGAFFVYEDTEEGTMGLQTMTVPLGFVAAGSIITYDFEMAVSLPEELKAIKVTAEAIGNAASDTSTAIDFITAPAPEKAKPQFAVTDIAQKIYHKSGNRVMLLTGIFDMDLLEDRSKWAVALVSKSDPNLRYEIPTKNITITSETTMSMLYGEDMELGDYDIEFTFLEDYADLFGNKYIGPTITIVDDESLIMSNMKLLGVVRRGKSVNAKYEILEIANKTALQTISQQIAATGTDELILVLEGEFEADLDKDGNILGYTALVDFSVNEVIEGERGSRLEYFHEAASGGASSGVRLTGVGAAYSAAKRHKIFGCDWKIEVHNGFQHSLTDKSISLECTGFTNVLLHIAMGSVSAQVGVLGKNQDGYTASYSGTINLLGYKPRAKEDNTSVNSAVAQTGLGVNLTCAINDILFDKDGFVGINTTFKAAFVATNVIGCAQQDVFALDVKINTIDNEYGGSGTITIKQKFVVGLGATMKEITFKDGKEMVLFDDINANFAVAPTSAVPVVPAVLGWYMVAMNLTDLLALGGDYSQANTAEEARLMANQATTNIAFSVGFVLFEAVTLNGTVAMGTNHFNLLAKGAIIAVPGFNVTATLGSNWKLAIHNHDGKVISPRQVSVAFKLDINAFDIIKGGGSFSYTNVGLGDDADFLDKNIFIFNFYGGVYLPKAIPIVGGMEVLGATGTISNPGISVIATILGNDIGVSYAWGSDDVAWLYEYDENAPLEENQMALSNMKYVAVKTPETALFMAADENYISGLIECGEGYTSLMAINYQGKAPSISDLRLTIDGNDYPLTAADANYQNGNAFVIPDTGEGGKILIGLSDPPAGEHNYKLTAPSDIRIINMEALNFTKVANATELIPNGDGTATVRADNSLKDSTVELYYIKDKEAYESITTEEYTDENGETQVRTYCVIDGEKVEIDEEFFMNFAEHRLATQVVEEDVSEITIKAEVPAGMKSGSYYGMALVRSPYGKVSRCITENAVEYVNPYQPQSIKGATVVNAGNEAIRVEVEDADDVDYTGYFVSIYNETDSKYESQHQYYEKDEDILIEKPVTSAGKTYRAEVVSVNVYAEDGMAEGADVITTAPLTVRTPEKVNITAALKNATTDGSYTDIDGNATTLPYVTDSIVTVGATAEKAVSGRFIVDDITGEWSSEMLTEFEHSIADLDAGEHTIYFEARNELGDITRSDAITFAISTGDPSVTLEKGAIEIVDGAINVKGTATATQKLIFRDKEYAVAEDGSFEFSENVAIDRFAQSYPLKAIGFDGKETTITLLAVNTDAKPIDSIVIKADGEAADSITMKPGETVKLEVVGDAQGVERDMGGDVVLSVYNGNNLVTLDSDNNLKALSPGTAYIKAVYDLGSRIDDERVQNYVYEDMIEVNILRQASAPVASIPDGAGITTSKKLELSADGDIYYTLDGSEPTIESTKYEGPITLPVGEVTVKVKVIKDGYLDSEVMTYTYNVKKASSSDGGRSDVFVPTETAAPTDTVPGTITAAIETETVDYGYPLELVSNMPYTIYYTTDGTTPNNQSTKYEGPIRITEDMTIRAVGWTHDDVYSDVYEYTLKLNPYDIYLKEDIVRGSLITGYPDKSFKPDSPITRAETATVLRRATEMYGYYIDENRFTDVEMWAKDSINELAAADVVNGYDDGTFKPDNQVTRAEFVAMLMRIIGNEGTTTNYSDTQGHWAEKYISKANEYGYINGYEDNTFRPDAPISRAEAIAVMSRVFSFDADGTATEFIDVTPEHWAFGYIAN